MTQLQQSPANAGQPAIPILQMQAVGQQDEWPTWVTNPQEGQYNTAFQFVEPDYDWVAVMVRVAGFNSNGQREEFTDRQRWIERDDLARGDDPLGNLWKLAKVNWFIGERGQTGFTVEGVNGAPHTLVVGTREFREVSDITLHIAFTDKPLGTRFGEQTFTPMPNVPVPEQTAAEPGSDLTTAQLIAALESREDELTDAHKDELGDLAGGGNADISELTSDELVEEIEKRTDLDADNLDDLQGIAGINPADISETDMWSAFNRYHAAGAFDAEEIDHLQGIAGINAGDITENQMWLAWNRLLFEGALSDNRQKVLDDIGIQASDIGESLLWQAFNYHHAAGNFDAGDREKVYKVFPIPAVPAIQAEDVGAHLMRQVFDHWLDSGTSGRQLVLEAMDSVLEQNVFTYEDLQSWLARHGDFDNAIQGRSQVSPNPDPGPQPDPDPEPVEVSYSWGFEKRPADGELSANDGSYQLVFNGARTGDLQAIASASAIAAAFEALPGVSDVTVEDKGNFIFDIDFTGNVAGFDPANAFADGNFNGIMEMWA